TGYPHAKRQHQSGACRRQRRRTSDPPACTAGRSQHDAPRGARRARRPTPEGTLHSVKGGQFVMTRPWTVTIAHMALLAVGYGRQSTKSQCEKHTGSTDYQRTQLRFPREWGWPEHLLLWLDDFGFSGTPTVHRPRYLELHRLVQLGQVGLVCVSDFSRL